jgi:hypothetical protein
MTGLPYEIPYKDPRHAAILQSLRSRMKLSKQMISRRIPSWDKADKLYRAYVQEDTDTAKRRSARDNSGEQTYVTLNIPYSYALLLSAHTYWTSVFLSRSPVMQFMGRHGETEQRTQALEALIDYQVQVGHHLVPYYIWLLDAGRYGIGVLGVYWDREVNTGSRIIERQKTFAGFPIPGAWEKVKEKTRIVGFEGNRVYNIRPYQWYPDPRVSVTNFQKGEFCGALYHVGWNTILKRAAAGEYFNIEELQKVKVAYGSEQDIGSSTEDLPFSGLLEQEFDSGASYRAFTELLEMDVELVPSDKEWQLGPGKEPEKWIFTVGNNSVIIGCRPREEAHGQFPYFITQYEIEGYSNNCRGMLEIGDALNKTLNWLVNSRYFNVRKSLNDQWLVDPSKIYMKDLTDGGPGRIIRLRPEAYGTNLDLVARQMITQDITANNLGDFKFIAEIMQRALGVNDNVMGMLNPGGRKSATEIRTSTSSSINRLKTFAEYNAALGWGPLAQVLVQNTQQFYDPGPDGKMFKIAGDLMNQAKFLAVTPDDIAGFFDYVPVDGTMPIDRFAQANLWKEIIIGAAQMPFLAGQFDLGGIFSWMARLAGLKNIDQFKVNVMPDQAMAMQAQAGNMIPAGAAPGMGSEQNVGNTMAEMMPPPDGMGMMQ